MNKKRNIGIFVLLPINIALVLALIVVSFAFHDYKKANNIVLNTNAQKINQTQLNEIIDVDDFKQYAQEFNVNTEFIQKLYSDKIVYKSTQGIVYEPINPNIPKHSYDLNNLIKINNRFEYQKDGIQIGKKGIDVSKYQGEIDWKKVKADDIDYAIMRLGYRGYGTGKILLDEFFHQNMKQAKEAGVDVGVYFFSQAITVEEAIEEANFVLENIKDYNLTYPVVFDTEQVESPDGRANLISTELRTDITIAFCEEIKKASYYPMIYANTRWLVAELDMTRLTQYDKWFAQYYKNVFFPYEFHMWQYTGKGKVDGITGEVDLNVSFVDYPSKIKKLNS